MKGDAETISGWIAAHVYWGRGCSFKLGQIKALVAAPP